MITQKTCQVCKHLNPTHADDCSHCGAPLRLSDTLRISDIMENTVFSKARVNERAIEPDTIALYAPGQENPIVCECEINDRKIIGRRGRDMVDYDIDLTNLHAGLLGVSRQHAAIVRDTDGIVLMDLASKNGTWVNGHRLTAYTPQMLRSGDEIRLGQLILFAYIGEINSRQMLLH